MESVMFLLSVHVDVNSKVRNQSVHTPLHLAIKKGSELLVRHLVSPQTRAEADMGCLPTHVRPPCSAAGWGQGDRRQQALTGSPTHGGGGELPCHPQCPTGERSRS